MTSQTPDDRSPMAVAYQWAWRVITISLEMVLPGLVGVWVDRTLHTLVLFTLLGFAGGMTLGIWHLLKITSKRPNNSTASGPGANGKQ